MKIMSVVRVMEVLKNLKYSDDHEWVKLAGDLAYIGITDFAQHSMGDIVFVELPNVGKKVSKGQDIGVIESFKSTSDVLTPVSGVIEKTNQLLNNAPELLNSAPYENWIAVIKIDDASELDALLDAEAYEKICKE